MIFSFFYNSILFVFLIVSFPKLVYQYLFHKKYRQSILWRLGFKPLKFNIPKNRKIIWLHAVSLGEAKAGLILLEALKSHFVDVFVVFSTITQTGQQQVKKSTLVDLPIYLPLDFSWIMKKLVRKIYPDIVFLIETDFWYHFLKCAHQNRAHVFVVSGILSKRSTKRFKNIPFFSKRLFSLIDFFCLQNQTYLNRYLSLNIPREKLAVCGNLKYDQKIQTLSDEKKSFWKQKFKVLSSERVIVIASTHEKEEELILDILLPLLEKLRLKIFIAPRHPERFASVLKLIQKKYNHPKITLIDQMGILPICYQISDLAILGGSFIPSIGGHNILEPCLYQLPVFFGPYMHSQKELEELILKHESGLQLPLEELFESVFDFFQNDAISQTMKKNIQVMKKNTTGSLAKTLEALIKKNKTFKSFI